MKSILSILSVMLFVVSTTGVFAQEIEENELIVFGDVKVFVKADRANVAFEIKGVGKSLKNAFSDARDQMDNIFKKLKKLGLNESNISTSFFQSTENYGDKSFWSSKKDYKTIMTCNIITKKIELLEKIAIILNEENVESVNDISFEVTDYSKLRIEGIAKATAKAKEKAQVIAGQLGFKVGRVLQLNEIEDVEYNIYGRHMKDSGPFNAPLIVQGDISDRYYQSGIFPTEFQFRSKVKVVFEIENL